MARYKQYMPDNQTKTQEDAAARIFSAARRLFLEKGLTATTTREIASAAGVTLGLIPYYFKTKDNLAGKIAYDLMERFYSQIDDIGMDSLSSAVKLYVDTLLIYDYQFSVPSYGDFFFELSATTEIMENPSQTARDLTWKIIEEYHLFVTEEENEIYLTALMGAEKQLIKKYLHKELNFTCTQLTDILLSGYFFNIGLSDETIASVIAEGQAFCDTVRREREMQLHNFIFL